MGEEPRKILFLNKICQGKLCIKIVILLVHNFRAQQPFHVNIHPGYVVQSLDVQKERVTALIDLVLLVIMLILIHVDFAIKNYKSFKSVAELAKRKTLQIRTTVKF